MKGVDNSVSPGKASHNPSPITTIAAVGGAIVGDSKVGLFSADSDRKEATSLLDGKDMKSTGLSHVHPNDPTLSPANTHGASAPTSAHGKITKIAPIP